MKLLRITPSVLPEKKYDAFFEDDGRHKKVSFGARDMEDYTTHKDKERRKRYLDRHKDREDWNQPDTAGALSRWILWGDSTSFRENVASFKKRFNL